MANDVAVTAGSGTGIQTDDNGGRHVQAVKLMMGVEDTFTGYLAGSLARGINVESRVNRQVFTITPTVSNGAIYATGDCLGGLTTVTNASTTAGLGGFVQSLIVLDKSQAQRSAFDILLFKASVTSAGDNAPAAFSDADMLNLVGIIPILTTNYNTVWPGTPLNSIAYLPDMKVAANPANVQVPYTCTATSLFVQLVVRGTPTYTSTTDIVLSLNCILD